MKDVKFEILKGMTIKEIKVNQQNSEEDNILFITVDNRGNERIFKMYHGQECSEDVRIKDVCGDVNVLIDSEIIIAEERIVESEQSEEGHITSTFYTLGTAKGYLDISWFGESNGYYSESVDFVEIIKE
jgi:hypothetical protein